MKTLLAIALTLAICSPAYAQPAHACGDAVGLSVIFDLVDAGGYAPRMKAGSQAQFDCIAHRDPFFDSQRFRSSWEAANHWLGLLGQELGQPVGTLPAPSTP